VDALSDVLQTIRLSGVIFLRANLSGQYGVAMPPPTISHPSITPPTDEHRLVMFHIVREGRGYVEVEGAPARELNAGDLIIVFDDLHHSVVDSPGRQTVASADLVPDFTLIAAPPAVHVGAGSTSLRLVCGMLQFVERGINPVFQSLPPFLHIRKEDGPSSAWLQESLTYTIAEAEAGRPGGDTLLSRLTELLFVETVRTYLQRLPASETGWLAALNDEMVGAAIHAVHARPAHPWTVAELAREVGASRSGFSARFSELLGVSPMAYVTQWRLRLATNLLEESTRSIAEIAADVGYESESAFARAFKRELGTPPATWRKQRAEG
jgi:AraC-like DNA-binding protein